MADRIFFGSNAIKPYYYLSNFSGDGPIALDAAAVTPAMLALCPELLSWLGPRQQFASSEHLWHALHKAGNAHTFLAFAGAPTRAAWTRKDVWLSQLHARFFLALGLAEAAAHKKAMFWIGKSMVGIMAKMAANPKHARSLGLNLRRTPDEEHDLGLEQLRAVWHDILWLKFAQNERARQTLLDTGETPLVELERHFGQKTEPFWGAYRDGERLRGQNVMGQCMMETRARLRAAVSVQ